MQELIDEVHHYLQINNSALREDLQNWTELINEYSGINQIILNYLHAKGVEEEKLNRVYEHIFKRVKIHKLDVLRNNKSDCTTPKYTRVEGIDGYIISLNNVNNIIFQLKKSMKNNKSNTHELKIQIKEQEKTRNYLAGKIMVHDCYIDKLTTIKTDYISKFDYSKADELDVLLDDLYIHSLLNFRVEDNVKIESPEKFLEHWLFRKGIITMRGKIVINMIDHFFWHKRRNLPYLVMEHTGELIQQDQGYYLTNLDIYLDNNQKKEHLNHNEFSGIIDSLSINSYLQQVMEKHLKNQELRVVHLLFWENKSRKEIAKITNRNIKTVHRTKIRALLKLKMAILHDFNNITENHRDTYLYTMIKRYFKL